MDAMTWGIAAVVALICLCIGMFVQKTLTAKRLGDADMLAKRIVDEARKEAQAQKK